MPLQKQVICEPYCVTVLVFIAFPVIGFCLILDWIGQFITDKAGFIDPEFIIGIIFFGISFIWIIVILIGFCISNKIQVEKEIENKTIENTNKQVEIQIHK